MKCRFEWLLGVSLSFLALVSASACLAEEAELRNKMEKRVYQDPKGEKLPYRLFIPPAYDPQKKYPLILFLHGAGERGDDNEAQLVHAQVLRLVADPNRPCFLVAPQCPVGRKWVEVPWDFKTFHETPAEPSLPMRLTMELLDQLDKEFSIDPDRRYVTGLSMGGFGTFDLLVRRPDYFAAAVPICGGADDSKAAQIAHVAIWAFHGSADGAVPVVRSRSIIEALKKAGANPKYTEYEGAGHNVWSRAYLEPELPGWLFSQSRRAN